jgi:CRP/FNR family transcriptional regulator, nitrogen oxide reductase regulator
VQVASATLRPFSLFRDASDDVLAKLCSRAERRVLNEDEPLWRMGDAPSFAHFIVRGLVQVVKRLPNGDEASLGLFGPFECAGILAVLGPGGAYPADAIAASEQVDVIRLPRAALQAAMDEDPALARAANHVIVSHAQMLRAKIDVLTAGEVPKRLATLLLHLGDRFGDESEDGDLMIPVALSRRTLARLVGVREETVIRTMTRWERESLVQTGEHGFLVRDSSALTRVRDGDFEDA